MTEADWLASGDQRRMLDLMGGWASERKLRLLAAACCRQVWQLITNPEWRQAVEAAELYADGAAAAFERMRELAPLGGSWVNGIEGWVTQEVSYATATPAERARWDAWVGDAATAAAAHVGALKEARRGLSGWEGVWARRLRVERRAVADLLRCVFGNPFRPITAEPSWLAWNDVTVPKLAQTAYDDRLLPSGELDPARLAVLADALEEAGCDNQEMLAHLRGPGHHVRGCWVVDLLLGKS
jgi:hypothetical protein